MAHFPEDDDPRNPCNCCEGGCLNDCAAYRAYRRARDDEPTTIEPYSGDAPDDVIGADAWRG